jgi:hypothetical protein
MKEGQTVIKPLQNIALVLVLCCATLTPIHAQTSGKMPRPQPEATTTTQTPTGQSEEAKKSCGTVGQTYLCVP